MRKSTIIFFVVFAAFLFSLPAYAQLCDPASTTLCDPTGAADLESFFSNNVFSIVAAVLGMITIAAVVYSGFRMIISRGESEAVAKAKTSLFWSIAGFGVIVLAFVIIMAVNQFLGGQQVSDEVSGVQKPIGSSDILSLGDKLIRNFLNIAGIIALLLIIINGFRYITAGGNEEQSESARQGLQWAIIGLVVILLAYVLVVAAAKLINAN